MRVLWLYLACITFAAASCTQAKDESPKHATSESVETQETEPVDSTDQIQSDASSTLFPDAGKLILPDPGLDSHGGENHFCSFHAVGEPEVVFFHEELSSLLDAMQSDDAWIVSMASMYTDGGTYTAACWNPIYPAEQVGGPGYRKTAYASFVSIYDENGKLTGQTDQLDRVQHVVNFRTSASGHKTYLKVQEFLWNTFWFELTDDGRLELELCVPIPAVNGYVNLESESEGESWDLAAGCNSLLLAASARKSAYINFDGRFISLSDCRMPDGRSAADVDSGYFIIRFGNDRVFPFSYVEDFDLSHFWNVRDEIPADSGLLVAN